MAQIHLQTTLILEKSDQKRIEVDEVEDQQELERSPKGSNKLHQQQKLTLR